MKRFLSILLCSAMLITAVPGMYYAQGFGGQIVYAQENSDIQEIDYQLNGGHYVSGYKAPVNYPVTELPDKDKIVNQGYEFGGWYDNAQLEGEPVTKISQGDYTGVVVLYAKWIERYYYINIPQSVDTSVDAEGEIQVSGHAGGLYEKDKVSVSVSSDNKWKLINTNTQGLGNSLDYGLYSNDNAEALTDNSVVSELTPTGLDKTEKYFVRLTEKPEYAGIYSDNLTFDISFETTRYNIKYVTNGGTLYSKDKDEQQRNVELKEETYEAGTGLSDLPSPGKDGAVFLGWCYDSSCTDYVDSDDRLLSDVVLYAAWTDAQELRTVSLETYARSYDVDADSFDVTVTDKTGSLTADEVKSLISIKNTSDSLDEISVVVSAKSVLDGEYTFSIKSGSGWQQGSSYRLELSDDRLYFTGYDTTIREYDFTVYKPEVRNTELNKDIKYISLGSLSDLMVDGKPVDSISVSAMTVGVDGTITDSTKVTGSFTYVQDKLGLGDKIAVYEGNVIPSLDTAAVTDEEVSFFEITSADGVSYTYRGLAAKEILFVPDVLPVNIRDDKDNDADNNSVTIAQDKLVYNNADMANADNNPSLGEDTTIDNGDYLALYDDTEDNIKYAVITEVSKTDTDYIIVYNMVTWEEVQAAMDIYQTDNINGDTILKNQDVQEIERSVEQQAADSGFAQSVANEVAKAVVVTDSYQELKEYLSDSLLADISVNAVYDGDYDYDMQSMDDGIAVYAGDNKPSVSIDHINADLSTKLQHFDNISGLRLALDIGVEIALSNMKVVVSATFEQEVKMNINVSGKAVWKKWKDIIPYIDDYRVAVSLDLYDYTGINFNVDVKTAEGDDDKEDENVTKLDIAVNKIAEELKNMMELGTTYISDNSDISTRLEDISDLKKDDSGDDTEDKEISVAKSLAERYSDMLENESDWVDLYTKSLTSSHVRVIGIIDVAFEVEFVVSANVNISMGMTYWYQNGKRYVYSIMVFSKNVTSDTIDLSEEKYEFSVYAIGTIGIRAGIRLSVGVGLISTKLASVGFSAEVGGYAQVWGYLYYQLKYAASEGRSASSMGAIYMEVGVYMQVDFLAQALAGTFSYNPTLFEKQWPLYSVGVAENVCDFTYGQEEYKDIKLKRDIKAVRIPETYFSMQYLDMKEGLEDGEYSNKIYADDSRYYVITMTNPAFTYDALTNVITVDPGDEPEQDGEMIITWKSQKGSFNTKPIVRRISLHWDNLRDGYYIAFQTNGGSIVDTVVAKYGKEVAKPEDPVKAGYTFAGWYEDEALTKKYEVPDTMPAEDRIVYAKWEASDMTYSVVDYVEGTDGVYNIADTRSETAKTDETVSVQPQERSGFITPPVLSQVVRADGSTRFNYYYARNKYNIKFVSEGEVVSEGSYSYGTQLKVPSVYRPGYEFAGWEPEVSFTVPATDMTYTAIWKESDDVVYTTKHYLEDENGGYVHNKTTVAKGTTGQEVSAVASDYDKSSYTVKDIPSGMVNADGSLVLKVYYDRRTYDITYDTAGGKLDDNKQAVKWGTKVVTQVPVRDGYAFAGWYTDKECTNSFAGVMPKENITLYAKWDISKVNYTVEHYMENTDGTGYELEDRQVYTTDVESEVTPEVKNVKGFTSPDKQTVKVNADSSTVIKYYYKRNVHKLTLKYNNGDSDGVYEYRYGTKLSVGQPVRKGYTFAGWDKDIAEVMPDEDVIYTADWSIAQFTISFKTDGGSEVESITQDYNTVINAPANPVKKGYTFIGWDKTLPDRMPAENMLLTAKWSKDVYRITYNLNGGEADNPDTYEIDSSVITLKTPVREGYTFTGWSGTGIDGVSKEVVITTGSTGDRTYTANWKENSYTVQFIPYGDGTTGSMKEMSLMYTDETPISENKFVRPGYTFEGWSVEAGGEKKYAPDEVISRLKSGDGERITLYPVWTANEYTVHFDTGGGEKLDDMTFTYDKEYKLPVAARNEYRFMGWSVEDGGAVIYLPGVSASNLACEGEVTLYASWLKVEFNYSNSNSYHVTDADNEIPVKFHFIIGERKSGNESYDDGRTNVIYMDGTSFEELKRVCTTMTFTITYKLDMDKDGWADMDITYRKASDQSWKGFKDVDIDIKKNDGKTLTYTYTINISDVDAICYRFDAHGSGADRYWLRNIRFNAKFS